MTAHPAQPALPLQSRAALITGGDSGIGRAVALAFARAGADVAIAYLDEHDDAASVASEVRRLGRRCETLPGDLADPGHCRATVSAAASALGRLDILVNNAGTQRLEPDPLRITPDQLERTFRVNVFAMLYLAQAALSHLPRGGSIINTASVTAYRGCDCLIDYAASKGAVVSLTRSLAAALIPRAVRVNAVAPGPVRTPLITATFPPDALPTFGNDTPMGRPAEPDEIAPAYVFLASDASCYITGQVLHPNGGEPVGG